jgi:transposase-like protein
MQEVTIRYSEAFKLRVVQEFGQGKFRTINEAQEKYGIRGMYTIQSWLKKYGREDILPKKVRIEMPNEKDQVKKLKKRIRDLERALADTQVQSVIAQAHFDVLCEQMGVKDIPGLKKKIADQLSGEGAK